MASNTKARNVLNPPLITAEPIVATVILARSKTIPSTVRQSKDNYVIAIDLQILQYLRSFSLAR